LEEALEKLAELKERTAKVSVGGGRAFNPGWNLAADLLARPWPRGHCSARRVAAAIRERTTPTPTRRSAGSTSS